MGFKEGVYCYYKYHEGHKDANYGEEMKKYRVEIKRQTNCFVNYTIQEVESCNGNYGENPLDDKVYEYNKKKISGLKIDRHFMNRCYDKFVIEIPHLSKPAYYGRGKIKHWLDTSHIHPWA